MLPVYRRERSMSEYEENNVSEFVESCITLRSNVSFHDFSGNGSVVEEGVGATVLLLGDERSLLQGAEVLSAYSFLGDGNLEEIVSAAPTGAVFVARITPSIRVLIGKVPVVASRHNCPSRPDIIHSIVQGAMREVSRQQGLDVYYIGPSGSELCIAAALARACNRSFSAKKGKAEHGYLDSGKPVRVFMRFTKPCGAALQVAATAVQLCQRLVDAPTNLLDTVTFTEIAVRCVKQLEDAGHNVKADVIMGEELRERGYGGLYGTGKAAEFPPALVTLTYKPKPGIHPEDKIALVGKGIVYDTGGLAIKSRDGMCTMKHDMGGAAAIFCAFLALVQLEAPLEVSCILCLADNAIGPRSQRNGDIIRMKSGFTVEVNNTDAEGRLVLSDGVYHASTELSYTPDIIVDMATLTGAQGIATGKLHAAVYANTEASEQRFVKAGRQCGDLCFPVVYCPELHNTEFKSAVADFRNSVANRSNAQVSCAGQFVGNNLAKNYKGEWVHIDMASPATYDEATGFGVVLLLQAFHGKAF